MQLAGAMSVVHTHLDKFLLSAWVALQAVTPYELGSRVLVSVLTLPQILLLAMLPAASVMHAAGDTARLHRLYERGTHYLHAASAITIAVLIGSADRLYATWTGPGHDTAALVLRALAVASAFAMATGMASITARAIGRTDLEAGYGMSTVVLHLLLSIVAVPAWGLVGALVASGVATVVTSIVFVARVARHVNLSRDEVLVRPNAMPALALVVGALAAWGLDRLLPAASGAAGWLLLVIVSAVAASAATAILVLSGFLRWREALALIGDAAAGNGSAA
jgi:O-antigen/teichoic acid export membrane protein